MKKVDKSVFNYTNYKKFIIFQIDQNKEVRGYQSQLADAAKCQKSYFSQMLRTKINLSPEQAMRLALFWNFGAEETEYFLTLVDLARTDFPPLKERLKDRLENLRANAENLAKRYTEVRILPDDKQSTYYSSWHWGALHIMVGIPRFQSAAAIAERLCLPEAFVRNSLTVLESMGLVRSEGDKWHINPGHIHIPNDSMMNSTNHANWRQRAVMSSQIAPKAGIHYTCVQSHSIEDFTKMKEALLKVIDETRGIMRSSPNEDLTCICLDFFRP